MRAVRNALDGWEGVLLLLAIGCAGLLVLGPVAPRELARTTWVESRAGGGGSSTNDSPAGYVGLVSLYGLTALAALLVAAWSLRARLAAALLATGAFASAAWTAVRYRRLLLQGVMGLEGRPDTTGWSAAYTIDPPELLPLFVLVAASGALLAMAYAVAWWPRRTERERW